MHKIYRRFFLIVFLMIIAMGIMMFTQYTTTQNANEDEILSLARLNLISIENENKEWLNKKKIIVDTTANFLTYNNWTDDIILGYFKLMLEENEDFNSIYYVTLDNHMVNGSGWVPPEEYDFIQRPWYQMAIKSNDIVVTEIFTNASEDDEIITIAMAIRDEQDKIIGVLGGDISFNTITETIKNYQYGGIKATIILNENKEILSIINKSEDDEFNQIILSEITNFIETNSFSNELVSEKIDVLDKKGYIFQQPILGTNWHMVSYVNIEEIFEPNDRLVYGFSIIFVFSIVIFIGITLIINYNIVRPIVALEKGVNLINLEENSSYRINLEEEVGFVSLANKINKVLDRVEDYLITIHRDRYKLNEMNAELKQAIQIAKMTEEELTVQKIDFEALFKNSADAIIRFDKNHLIVDINNGFEKLFGYELYEIEGKEVDSIVSGEENITNARALTKEIYEGKYIRCEGFRRLKSGDMIEVSITGIPISVDEKLSGGYAIYSDISKRKEIEREIIRQKANFEALFKNSTDAIVLFDSEKKIVEINQNFTSFFEYELNEIVGKNVDDIIANDDIKIDTEMLTNSLLNGSDVVVEGLRYGKNNLPKEVLVKGIAIKNREKEIIGGYGIYSDISTRKQAEREILFMGYHDQLTGLYNRRFFEEELIRLNVERNLPIALVMADVNGLKLINDAFGHQTGDELLKKTANIFKSICRGDEIIARLGGDEFVILMPKTSLDEAENIVERIKNEIKNEKIENIEISISFGWDTKEKMDESVDELFKRVEDYMYRNKLVESPSVRGRAFETIIKTLHEKNKREERHSKRVSELCGDIAREMGMNKREINEMKTAGWLHDIGKIAIDESILNKKDKLNDEEWNEIKRHPEIGYRILGAVNEMAEISEFILTHHERWDGKGYPQGLKEKEVPLQGRIIAVADAYDAMTRYRTYRDVLSEEEAIVEMKNNSGTQFDSEIIEIFVDKVLKK